MYGFFCPNRREIKGVNLNPSRHARIGKRTVNVVP